MRQAIRAGRLEFGRDRGCRRCYSAWSASGHEARRWEAGMKSYRVVEFSEPLQCMDVTAPSPRGREVLVAVRGAGVCHSDVHIWEGGYDLGQGRRLSLKDRGISLPLTMGHEIAGEIV